MKRFASLTTPTPLGRQLTPLHLVRGLCRSGQFSRAAGRDRRPFSLPTVRACNSGVLSFKKYTLPQGLKPGAGIDLPAAMGSPQDAAPRQRTAYIALGSNMGDRIGWIEKACNEMDARGIRVKRTSSLWETEPMYVVDQDRFVNGACEVRQSFCPPRLVHRACD